MLVHHHTRPHNYTRTMGWNDDAIRVSGGIAVSRNDKREWHTTTLPNGLVVVCVSDAECVTGRGRVQRRISSGTSAHTPRRARPDSPLRAFLVTRLLSATAPTRSTARARPTHRHARRAPAGRRWLARRWP